MPPYAFYALLSAITHAIGSVFNKEAMAGGIGLRRQTALMMRVAALYALPFLFFATGPVPWARIHEPLLAALCFGGGQVVFVWALRTGDVGVVVPVAGAKPILNALLVAGLLRHPVAGTTWAACGLTALALLVMRSPNASTSHGFLRTAGITLLSMFLFALSDTCFQHWAPDWGVMRFAALTYLISAVGITFLSPRNAVPWRQLSRSTRYYAWCGAALGAIPPIGIGWAIGHYGHAPEINVIYSTRALFSLGVIYLLGKTINSPERHVTGVTTLRRIAGAILMLGAVALAFNLLG